MSLLPKDVVELINKGQDVAKVLATISADGKLNVAPKGSLMALDDETLAYAELYGLRSHQNLQETKKASVLIYKITSMPPFIAYQLIGTYEQIHTTGPIFEKIAGPIVKMGLEVKGVNTIKVEEVYTETPTEPHKKVV